MWSLKRCRLGIENEERNNLGQTSKVVISRVFLVLNSPFNSGILLYFNGHGKISQETHCDITCKLTSQKI